MENNNMESNDVGRYDSRSSYMCQTGASLYHTVGTHSFLGHSSCVLLSWVGRKSQPTPEELTLQRLFYYRNETTEAVAFIVALSLPLSRFCMF